VRAVFLLLLIANALFFGWLMSGQDLAGSDKQVKQQTDVASITLLRETHSGQQAAAVIAEQAAENPADSSTEKPQQEADASTAEPAPVAPVTLEQPPAVPKKPARKPQQQVIASVGPVADSCHTIGPFRDINKLRDIIKAIKADVLEASFRSRDEQEQSLYWVYLRPGADLDSARATTRMLRQKSIKDSYIILEGEKQNGISLGHFREKLRARTLRDRIAKLGFKPQIEPVFRNYTIYWLDYRLPTGKSNSDMLQGLKLDKSINQFVRPCA
jgi:hypothetical protein